ncbi:U3 small nucleolar RNA-associated protein 14 homolog A [Chanos chanos]|uniref:U3 small nucleolar RNA-associated protein 14 homolog A n=1 Tax=Chanos chanos TaxID=29144 RepID=A0A6J2WVZ5_CHACN|nr:U3 small nucleolar RNA-associated protein 14 homolog A-like [Chanos chanos]
MAKTKTASKKGTKLKKASQSVKAVPPVAAAAADDDDDLSLEDENVISASEDEEGSEDERRHTKLLEAISALGGKKKKKLAERSEASLQVSEFSVNADGAGEKINLSELLGTMTKTPGTLNKTQKQLKNLQQRKKTLELPLSKQETERIQRGLAYEKTAKEVSQWESVINQNQRAEQLVFPLQQESSAPKRVEQVVVGWKAQTPLEQEIFKLLHNNKQPIHDPVLTPVEEASLKAMSLEEAKIRRAELQKARALQSYYEAKAKRERKIKSKKYHKVQKKAKRKEFQKQFDEMVKTDPTGALEELKKMELARMEERMSLKHQNSGKWAKTKAIMAKYDDSARKAMQEQLEVNKELTQKLVLPSDDEDDEGNKEDPTTLPDFVNDPEPLIDPVNPWMRGKLTNEVSELDTPSAQTESQTTEGAVEVREEDDEENEEETEEEKLLREFENRRKLRQAEEEDLTPAPVEESKTQSQDTEEAGGVSEDEEVSEFNTLFTRLMNSSKGPAASAGEQGEAEGLLEEGLVRVQTLEDLEDLAEDVGAVEPSEPASKPSTETPGPSEEPSEPPSKKNKKEIDPNTVLTKDATSIKVPLTPTVVENEEDHDEQTNIIKEAFAGDDVISDFLKDKREQEEAGKPKVVDLTLPGWGEWGGGGLKPSRHKRRKFQIQVATPPPRKDQKLPAVIISEKRDGSVASHQVSQLPFPFENPAQFETTIRTPVGYTWNTQTTFKKMTAPKVITRMGAIIEPMAKEDLMKDKTAKGPTKEPAIKLSETENKKRKGSGKREKAGE